MKKLVASNFLSTIKYWKHLTIGEFVTATVFQLDSLTLLDFVRLNHFDTLISTDKHVQLLLFSRGYFKEYKPDFSDKRTILYTRGQKQKNNWTYVADLKDKKLWVEIQYPDFGGK